MANDIRETKDCLCVIPARGGSKGLPHKNILPVCGQPLITYSIETALAAKSAGLIDTILVSTDDREIAQVAAEAGTPAPFLRPDDLASDKAKSVDVVLHALKYYEDRGTLFNTVLLLQPTSPLRSVEDIAEAREIMRHENGDSLISCYQEEYICDLVSYRKRGNSAVPLSPEHNKGHRRQEDPPLFVRNGAIYLTRVEYLKERRTLVADMPLMLVMPKSRSVNIDTKDDLRMLEWMLQS